jgi:ATP-dependent DNA helicase RecQ
VPALENFAYGDTPTPEALAGVLGDVLRNPVGSEFAVSEYELSARHDVRPLVLRTALTYLELDGVLRQGTPFYAGYRFRPLVASFEDVFSRFDVARAQFLRRLVDAGKTGRVWTSLAPDDAAAELGEPRTRIVAALDYLEQQGLIELQPAELRQRYTVLPHALSEEALVDRLLDRFARREHAEVERVEKVLALVTHDGCQVNSLVGYFGEQRSEPCGHCTNCLTGRAQELPVPEPKPAIESVVDAEALAELSVAHPEALGAPRQRARLLAGITSPATTRAKLTRHELFGSLADRRFADVLAWCETTVASGL